MSKHQYSRQCDDAGIDKTVVVETCDGALLTMGDDEEPFMLYEDGVAACPRCHDRVTVKRFGGILTLEDL